MDWITTLKAQQTDFIERLKFDCLLHCDKEGQHSELTVISGEKLNQLRNFCWEMVGKYRPNNPKNYFIKNLKGKLGEEAIQSRLASFVTKVDYNKYRNGDNKTDFNLTNNPEIGIQVKTRYGSIDKVEWHIKSEEVQKNSILVCVLIQEEVNEAQSKYNLILAGFLPTKMIDLSIDLTSYKIHQLLYCGGLRCYLENLILSPFKHYVNLGDNFYKEKDYENAIGNYNVALQHNYESADTYLKRGNIYLQVGQTQKAIEDFTQAIKINPDCILGYSNQSNLAMNKYNGIEDYIHITKINPSNIDIYYKVAIIFYTIKEQKNALIYFNKIINLCLEEYCELCLLKAKQFCLEENDCLCLCLTSRNIMCMDLEKAYLEENISIFLTKRDGELWCEIDKEKLYFLDDNKQIIYSNAIWFIKRINGAV